jgi:hypothetical protein
VCGKLNHFAKVCKSKTTKFPSNQTIHNTHDDSSSSSTSDEWMFSLTLTPEDVHTMGETEYKRRILTMLMIGDKLVKFPVDTGATCNVINENARYAKRAAIRANRQSVNHVQQNKDEDAG